MSILAPTKPHGKTWRTAKLFAVDFTSVYLRKIHQGLPVSGERMVWAIAGHKHVRICTPITNLKFRMRRDQWDQSPVRSV